MHWVPGSNTNQGKDRHVRKRQGLQGTGWTLQTRGKAFGDSSPCTINDQGTGSPRSLSNAGAEKGSEGAGQRRATRKPSREATASTLRSGLDEEQTSRWSTDQTHSLRWQIYPGSFPSPCQEPKGRLMAEMRRTPGFRHHQD